LATIHRILTEHNGVEKNPGGVYETCELLAGSGIENVLLRLRAVPAVPVARHKDGPLVMDATHRALLGVSLRVIETEDSFRGVDGGGLWRREPFRIFFPLGVVLAWLGIGHWLL
jgi:hypothetical protein